MKFVETSTPAVVTSTVRLSRVTDSEPEFELENRRFCGSRSVGWCALAAAAAAGPAVMPADSADADIELSVSRARPAGPAGPARHGVTDLMIELPAVLERCSSLNLNVRVAESGQRAAVHGSSRWSAGVT